MVANEQCYALKGRVWLFGTLDIGNRELQEQNLAEGMGFEPTVRLKTVQRFSKPPPSATRPPLRYQHYGSDRLV